MKMIVGLGNPGRKYEGTRHNVGFKVVDELAVRYGRSKPRLDFQAEILEADIDGEKALLVKPQTFMNLSGGSVLAARDFYKLDVKEVLVVCDDFNLPLGQLRARPSGSAGGQKGLDDVICRLGGEEIPRLRIGVGTPTPGHDAADYVLSRFKSHERAIVDDAVFRGADAVRLWAREGIAACMARYNERLKKNQ